MTRDQTRKDRLDDGDADGARGPLIPRKGWTCGRLLFGRRRVSS